MTGRYMGVNGPALSQFWATQRTTAATDLPVGSPGPSDFTAGQLLPLPTLSPSLFQDTDHESAPQ